MTKLVKFFAVLALIAGAFAATAGSAQARHWHHHHYHGGWGFGFGYPYAYSYYAPPPVYYGPACRWERVRIWRHGHWRYRSVKRCW